MMLNRFFAGLYPPKISLCSLAGFVLWFDVIQSLLDKVIAGGGVCSFSLQSES